MEKNRSLAPVATVPYSPSVFCCTLSLEEDIVLTLQQLDMPEWCFTSRTGLQGECGQRVPEPELPQTRWAPATQTLPRKFEFPVLLDKEIVIAGTWRKQSRKGKNEKQFVKGGIAL